jgi:protein associated with RNAse G/E
MGDERESMVRVEYRKYDGALHWNLVMHRFGADRHGTWLGLPAASIMRKGEGPPVPIPQPHVILFPNNAWYTAVFNGEPAEVEVYCDLTTPPAWPAPDLVTMVDLDLDVLRRRGQAEALLVDEDESTEHQVLYGYPSEVIDAAQAAARDLLAAVTARTGAFNGAHQVWLEKAAALGAGS